MSVDKYIFDHENVLSDRHAIHNAINIYSYTVTHMYKPCKNTRQNSRQVETINTAEMSWMKHTG